MNRIPACPHRPTCPGCPRFGALGGPPALRSELAEVAREHGLALPEPRVGDGLGFRHRARLAVRGRASSPKLGLFQAGSHRIADIPSCPIHHPEINRVARALRDAVRATGTAPYADRPHRGALRYAQLAVERSSGRVQLVLVGNAHSPDPLADLIDALGPLELHSLWWNGQPERSNAILGPHWKHLSGPEFCVETIGDARVFFPPGAFAQSHLELADQIAAQVRAWVPERSRVAELYAGCGAIGLGLLTRSAQVVFNERSADGLAGLAAGIDAHAHGARARVAAGPAGERLDALSGADVVIVDPPRRGLDAALLEELCVQPPRQLIYVSCGWPSLRPEIERLTASAMQLRELCVYDLFPYTDHLEVAARFERR